MYNIVENYIYHYFGSFKSSGNIQKKEGGPDRSVSNHQFSSVTLNELAMKARENSPVISCFNKAVNPKTDIIAKIFF